MKVKNIWACIECGTKHTKWAGQCGRCLQWNTLNEEIDQDTIKTRYTAQVQTSSHPIPITKVKPNKTPRITTKIEELDQLLGGGIVPGSLSLIGGDPGIGKSTLTMQVAASLAVQGKRVLLICGEESVEQTSLRATRLGIQSENLFLLSETEFSKIKQGVDRVEPEFLVVDSIQVVYKGELSSAPGSISQVRETASELMHLAKGRNIATFIIGHVTKTGEIAGPRVLEHLVDTVLYFEGDKHLHFRMVRVVKNRFGATDEIALFEMRSEGLVPVPNPSQIFLEERSRNLKGSVVIPTIEGSRALLIEAQALVTETPFPTPSRRSTGLDPNRLALLLAVLEKRMRFPLYKCDVFVSLVGGIKAKETALDLGILLAVASSMQNKALDADTVVIGEVGLGGEVRSVSRFDSRIKEAINLGFKKCIAPKHNCKSIPASLAKQIEIKGVEIVDEAVRLLLS